MTEPVRSPAADQGMSGKRRLIPAGCTLDDIQGGRRIGQWRQALGGMVTRIEREQPSQLRLVLVDDPARIGALVALARAETACCSFFDFTIKIGAEAITFVIDVSAGSETVLDGFTRLAT